MAWEWSHTNEAYENARENLSALPDNVLATIWAEWRVHYREGFFNQFNEKKYPREIRRAHSWIYRGLQDEMIDWIWEKARDLSTCTNGGWEAWLCPFGCGCHMVSFDREDS